MVEIKGRWMAGFEAGDAGTMQAGGDDYRIRSRLEDGAVRRKRSPE